MTDLPRIEVHGRDVAEADARAAGEAMVDLLNAVSKACGYKELRWQVATVAFMCDGCEHQQPFDAPREGWTHRDGDDFCATCSARP
jgi:hypothetical protein